MKNTQFKKTLPAASISLVLGAAFMTPAMAQQDITDADPEYTETLEEIVVMGIRGSLIRSMDFKRDATGVVDAISAEDIGKFPDTNLAESLQRITGVSVSRSNGEGSQITVRGFGPSFNLITLNGRQMPGTGNTRSYSLENLSSDAVSVLEVHKTARADNPSGGLGATVNIVTLKPLENPGEKFVFSGKAIHDSSNVVGEDITPELSAIYSNTFADDRFGVAVSLNHQRRDFQQQQANIRGWHVNVEPGSLDASNIIDGRPLDVDGNPIGHTFFPRNLKYGITDLQRERKNANVTFQYAPVDNLTLSMDYTATEATTGSNHVSWGMWNEFGGNISAYELDENGTAIAAEIAGNDAATTYTRETRRVSAGSLGFNVDWQATDTLSLVLDYHDSSNKSDNAGDPSSRSMVNMTVGSDQLETKFYDYRSGDVPQFQVLWDNGTYELAPGDIDSHYSKYSAYDGESEIKQLQLHGNWENTFDNPLVNVEFGLARTEQNMGGFTSSTTNGVSSGYDPDYTHVLPDGMFSRVATNDFLDEFGGGGSDLLTNYYYMADFDELAARTAAFFNEASFGDDHFSLNGAFGPKANYKESAVQEETTSIYIQSAWEFDVRNIPIYLNIGARYEKTDVTSSKLQPVPIAVWWQGGSEWHTQFAQSEINFLEQYGSHDVFIPMVDLKADLSDDIIARASWGKSIARAPLGSLAGGLSLSTVPKINSRTGGSGNTSLLPYESTNFDLSIEYYYAEGSYASIGYFRKDVENFLGNTTETTTIDGIHDIYLGPRWQQAEADVLARGEQNTHDAIFAQMLSNGAVLNEQGYLEPEASDPLMEWDVTFPFNGPDSKVVDGIEIAVQHLFGETGFGVSANATIVNGDVEFDVTSLEHQRPLTGLGDSANFRAFYEDDSLSFNVVYAWRDSYLKGVGQAGASSDRPPQFAKEFGQWDMSVNYSVAENMTVFFEGINLNNETEQTFGRYERQFLNANQYGRRFALGARFNF